MTSIIRAALVNCRQLLPAAFIRGSAMVAVFGGLAVANADYTVSGLDPTAPPAAVFQFQQDQSTPPTPVRLGVVVADMPTSDVIR